MNKYDATNYIKHPSLIVDSDGVNFTALSSSLLLIKWHVLLPNRDRKLRDAGEVTIETHTPLGNLPETKRTLIQSADSKLIQFLHMSLIDRLPYDLTFTNGHLVTKSQLTVWEFIPNIISPNFNGEFHMSSAFNPTQFQSDTALVAAVNNVATSNQLIADNVASADESKQMFDATQGEFVTSDRFDVITSAAVVADAKTREVILTNNNSASSGVQFKVILGTANLPAPGTLFADITNYEQTVIIPGGSQVISDPTCRAAIYVIGSSVAPVNVARSFLVLPVVAPAPAAPVIIN